MTEGEWRRCTNPNVMLYFLEGEASDRKLRLFAVACCHRVWNLMADARCRKAVEIAEQYADGVASLDVLSAAHNAASEAFTAVGEVHPDSPLVLAAMVASGPWKPQKASNSAALARPFVTDPNSMQDVPRHKAAVMAEWAVQADLLRDLIGNPFGPVPVDAAWLAWQGGSIAKLAQAIYDERAFDRLPVLADALEEAGCDNADILTHLRGPGPHTRGCWPVDLLLGKG